MSYTDRQILKNRQQGQAQTYGAVDPNTAVAQAHSYLLSFTKAADDGSASTTTAETYTGKRIPYQSLLKSLNYIETSSTGVTASDTLFVTVTISVRDKTAANPLVIATLVTKITGGSGNLAQGVPYSMPLTVANVVIAAGSTVTYAIAKASTGTVFTAGEFVLELEAIGPAIGGT